jgi:nucleoside phosphorylase
MSFFINTLIRSFLAQQAITLVQREVTSQVERELRLRREAADQAASIRDGQAGVIDFAIVFSQRHEAIGLLDRFPDAAVTQGNGNTFYAFAHRDKRVVVALPEDDSREKLELVTNAVLDIFRPQRVVTAGFAVGIAPGTALLSLYVPNVLIDTAAGRTIDLRQMQLAAPQPETDVLDADVDATSSKADNTPPESFETFFRVGTIVTTRRPLLSVAQKQELRKTYAAQLADRSVFPVFDLCQRRGVPVLPMRIVTSLYNEELPRDVKPQSANAHPARRFGALLGNFVRRPGSVIDAIKLKQRQLEATDVLADRIVKLLLR